MIIILSLSQWYAREREIPLEKAKTFLNQLRKEKVFEIFMEEYLKYKEEKELEIKLGKIKLEEFDKKGGRSFGRPVDKVANNYGDKIPY